MPKLFRSLFALLGLTLALSAQTVLVTPGGPTPVGCPGGACRGNSIPFSATFANDYCFQMHIPASALQSGPLVLTDIAFGFTGSGTRSFTDFTLSVGHDQPGGALSCTFAANSPDLTV